MKKVLALILALIMICSTATMLAYAESETPDPAVQEAAAEKLARDLGLVINVPLATTAPELDGVVEEGEYTASREVAKEALVNSSDEVQSGITEYFAHDAEWIYYAAVFTQANDNRAFWPQWKNGNTFNIFNEDWHVRSTAQFRYTYAEDTGASQYINGGVSVAAGLPAMTEGTDVVFQSGKDRETNVKTYEVKFSKAYFATVNDVTAADVKVLPYCVSFHAGPWLGGAITPEAKTAITTAGFSIPDNATSLYYFMNLLPYADFEQATEAMGLHVSVPYTTEAPVLDGTIGEDEYPGSKYWAPEDIHNYDASLLDNEGVTEYFAHDDDFIYYAVEFTQALTNKAFQWQFRPHNSFAIYNAKEPDIDTTLFQRVTWQIRMVSYEGEDLWCDGTGSWAPKWNYSGGDWRVPVYDQDLFYAGAKAEDNTQVYEIKLSKAYVAELNGCQKDEVRVISYFDYFHGPQISPTHTAEGNQVLLDLGATRADAGELFYFMVLEAPAAIEDTIEITTSEKASVRISATNPGLRFTSAVNTADLAKLVAKFGEENVKVGTLIALNAQDLTLTHETASKLDVAATVSAPFGTDGDNTIFAGSVSHVKAANLTKEFAARGYIAYNDGTAWNYIYSDVTAVRDITTVVNAALADEEAGYTQAQIDVLNAILTPAN